MQMLRVSIPFGFLLYERVFILGLFFFSVQSPPRIVKQPPTDELLFQVAQQQSENDKPFFIECEAEGEPAPKYRWIKNGKPFEYQVYDNRMSQQPGRGTLVITSPRDEDLGKIVVKGKNLNILLNFFLFFFRAISMFCRKQLGSSYFKFSVRS